MEKHGCGNVLRRGHGSRCSAERGSLLAPALLSDERHETNIGDLLFLVLIVGDADYYLKYDEEFDRCKSELAKIVAEIERLKQGDLSVDALMHLNVLCREADSLLVLAQHYLESRDRVRSFEESTKTALDRDTARTLAKIIESMVASRR